MTLNSSFVLADETQISFKKIICDSSSHSGEIPTVHVLIFPNGDSKTGTVILSTGKESVQYPALMSLVKVESCSKHPAGCGGAAFYYTFTAKSDDLLEMEAQFPEGQSPACGSLKDEQQKSPLACFINY